MLLRLIVFLSSIECIIWLFPAFRQYKGRYFGFFLCLALASLLQMVFVYLHLRKYVNYLDIFYSVYILYSFLETKVPYLLKIILPLSLVILEVGLFQLHDHRIELICVIIIWMVILSLLLRRVLLETATTGSFNIFTLSLILYTLSILLRVFFAVTETNVGLYYYAITEVFECILGVAYICFTEENKFLYITIK